MTNKIWPKTQAVASFYLQNVITDVDSVVAQ